ncbi:MAG TPA: hypothetical protein VL463_16560 [Kofleriaceae bacterium]|jgi:hypothetical protein|nr:hypothetical protein [Kofleriaceae bacterium]
MRIRTISICLAASLGLSTVARADTRLGLGAAASAEARGLSADLALDHVLVEATLGGWATTYASGDHVSVTRASIGALVPVAKRDRATLYAGLRLDALRMDPANPPGTLTTEPLLAAPLRIQLDVTSWLSVDAEAAIVLVRAGSNVQGGQVVSPSAGFTVWF